MTQSAKRTIELDVDGEIIEVAVRPHHLLVDVLREGCGRISVKEGCESANCGACTVLIDGQPTLSCITLAVDAVGHPRTLGDRPLTRLRHRDDPGAAVGAGRPPLGEPGPFQRVDRDHHRGLVQVGDLRELDLGALGLQRVEQHAVLARRDVDLGEGGRHPRGERVAGLGEQQGEVDDGTRRGAGAHVVSLPITTVSGLSAHRTICGIETVLARLSR